MNQQYSEPEGGGEYAVPGPGMQLRMLREAAGLSLDDVSHHLKLARRQVVAIENDDHGALPGPTFVRGFIRNYARLLRVDPQPLLEAGGLAVPPADPVQPIARNVGELPLDDGAGVSWTRWLIPLGLVAVLAGGIAVYEMSDVAIPMRKLRKDSTEPMVASPAMPSTGADATSGATPDAATSMPAPGAAMPNTAPPTPAGTAPSTPAPLAPANPAAPPAPAVAPSSAAGPAPAGQVHLDIETAAASWIEVKDARGEILLSRNLPANSSHAVNGTPPLALRIGNVRAVQIRFNGAPVDLRPHSQREIARLTLPLAGR